MRLLTDETFTELIQLLAKDEKVKVYSALLLSQKVDSTPNEKPTQPKMAKEITEVKK